MTQSGQQVLQGDAIEQASAWCLRLAEGRLTPDMHEAFQTWLAADAKHGVAFDDVVRTWQVLEQTHLSPEMIAMRRGALDSFRRGHAARWSRTATRRRRVWSKVAAALVLAVVAGGLWATFVPQRYQTGMGERRMVVLADGSTLSLDAQSRVDVRLSGDRRELWLRRGRAKFQVARDSLRPFSVSAADKMVVATGTAFSVELLANRVHVILYEGGVDILADEKGALQPVRWDAGGAATAHALPSKPQPLPLGQELVLAPFASKAVLQPVDPVRSLSWESGQLVFNDEPLQQAIERVNRYSSHPFVIQAAGVDKIRISGTFQAGDAHAFIEGITSVFPVRVELSEDSYLITLAR